MIPSMFSPVYHVVSQSLAHLGQQFLGDRRGNVAIIFSLASVPMLVSIGAAVDYGSASDARAEMQAALDAATMQTARAYADGMPQSSLKAYANASFKQAIQPSAIGAVDDVNFVAGQMQTTASANVDTSFLKLANIDVLPVRVHSAAALSRDLELGIMLDVTGSMSDDIDDLKLAVGDLLDRVMAANRKKREVGVVAFSHSVNAGEYFKKLTGLDRNYTVRRCGRRSCWYETRQRSACIVDRMGSNQTADLSPTGGNVFRSYDLDKPYASHSTIRGSNIACAPNEASAIQPLTASRPALDSKITALTAYGATAGHLGAALTWSLLSPNFSSTYGTAVAAYNDPEVLKVAILMSDGQNNVKYRGADSSDSQMAQLCTNMKAKGVVVYAIGYDMAVNADGTPNTTNSAVNLMMNCATSEDHYHFPYSPERMTEVFRAVGDRIASTANGLVLVQ